MEALVAVLILVGVLSAGNTFPAMANSQDATAPSQRAPDRIRCLPCHPSTPVIRDLTVADPHAANRSPAPCDE